MQFSKSLVLAVLAMAAASPMGGEISPQITKNCQEVDQMVISLVKNLSHLTAEFVSNFVTGLSSTIESTVSGIENMVSENPVSATVLSPFVDSIAKGSGFLVSALASNPKHLVSHVEVQQLVSSLEKVQTVAKANHLNTHELSAVMTQLNNVNSHLATRDNHFNPIFDAIKGGATNAEQTIETLIKQLGRNDGHPAADAVSALITGLDSQIDNLINMVATALGPLTFGVSNLVGDAILGPVFQSITNGAEVVISNLAGGAVDLVTQPVIQLFVHTLSRAVEMGKKNNVKNVSKLEDLTHQLSDLAAKAPAKAPAKTH